MRGNDPNLPYLRVIAHALGDLCADVVFVGGATTGLLVTDALVDDIRATKDIDAIVEARLPRYLRIESQLAAAGFARDMASEVICRWMHQPSGVLFDLMPIDADVLGFSNRWYRYAVETAQSVDIGDGLIIRMVTAVAFVATKLEAYADRGKGDFLYSHDLEDVLNIIDGREELGVELAAAPLELQAAIRKSFADLLSHPDFANVLPGLITDSSRSGIVLQRFRSMAI